MKRLLIVVDYQNDFIDGTLGFEGAEKIAPRIVELIKEFENDPNGDVIFTYDTHTEDYLNTTEGQNLPIKHCIKGTEGFNLHPSIDGMKKDHKLIYKGGFGSGEIGQYIKDKNFDEVHLCGLVTDICVFANAVIAKAAANPYAKVFVRKDACATFNKVAEENAYFMLKNLHIEII